MAVHGLVGEAYDKSKKYILYAFLCLSIIKCEGIKTFFQ